MAPELDDDSASAPAGPLSLLGEAYVVIRVEKHIFTSYVLREKNRR